MKEVLRRISGVAVKPTEDTRYCRHCRREVPVVRAITALDGKQYVNMFCDVCERYLGGYKIKRGET